MKDYIEKIDWPGVVIIVLAVVFFELVTLETLVFTLMILVMLLWRDIVKLQNENDE